MPAEFNGNNDGRRINWSTGEYYTDNWGGFKQLGVILVVIFFLCSLIYSVFVPLQNRFTPDYAFEEISARLESEGITGAEVVNHTLRGHLIQSTNELQMTIQAEGRLYHVECVSDLHPMLCSYYEQGRIKNTGSKSGDN